MAVNQLILRAQPEGEVCLRNSYSTGPGIYGSKRTKSEGVARGQGSFTAINPWGEVCLLNSYCPF